MSGPGHGASGQPGDPGAAECDCPCHRGVPLLHPIPCCRACPECGRRFLPAALAAHLASAHPGCAAAT